MVDVVAVVVARDSHGILTLAPGQAWPANGRLANVAGSASSTGTGVAPMKEHPRSQEWCWPSRCKRDTDVTGPVNAEREAGARGSRAGCGFVCVLAVFNQYPEDIYPTTPEPEPSSQPHVALLVDYPVLLRAIRATDPDAVPRLGDILRR